MSQSEAVKKRTALKKKDSQDDKAAALLAQLEAEGITRAKIGGFDVDGVLRGKYVSLAKLRSALGKGFGFCDVIFGWDIGDVLYDNAQVTGWHSGYPDVHALLDASTLRRIPWEPGGGRDAMRFSRRFGRRAPRVPAFFAQTRGRGLREARL